MSGGAPAITPDFVAAVADRYARGKRVRRLLPGEGRLHIDRPLPFLCLYRRPSERASRVDRLVMTQASYLVAGGPQAGAEALRPLVEALARRGAEAHGGFLVVELWEQAAAGADSNGDGGGGGAPVQRPAFTVTAARDRCPESTLRRLEQGLEAIRFGGAPSQVYRESPAVLRERGVEPLAAGVAALERCFWIGLGVAPIYRGRRPPAGAKGEGPEAAPFFPVVFLDLETRLAAAVLAAVDEFARAETRLVADHPQALGRRALVRSAWNIDRRLAEVADSFEFLRLSTPVNEGEAWQEFEERGFDEAPVFRYAPLPIDPEAIKRDLFNLPIERVEDPTLARLFREKQEELDRKIDMLRERGTPRYLYGSLALYGPVEGSLLRLAEQLLYRLPSHQRDDDRDGYLPAEEMAARAREEIASYRRRYAKFPQRVELRDDLPPTMMVSKDRLLICAHMRIPRSRVEALLHHEVGTHLLTYCNGRAQPLRLLYAGLPGYDALQEGLAVLAEYLVGGLSRPRLRLLAARVVACQALIQGATFVETFHKLVDDHGFPPRSAFTITTRVYRGGGLTKDAVYLRGLIEILDYLGGGGSLQPLFVGKLARHHLADVEELWRRGVLRPAPLKPNYLHLEEVDQRLARLREGMSVLGLAESAEPVLA